MAGSLTKLLLKTLVVSGALLVGHTAWALTISEEPYASASLLKGKYQPVVDYLQKQNINASYLRTESYAQYVAQAREHKIDVAFASTGLASLLASQCGYTLLFANDNKLNAVVVVPSASPLQTLEQVIKGDILAPEPYDIVSEMGKELFRAHGLEQHLQSRITVTPKIDHIIMAVLTGKYPAGIVAGYDIELVSPDLRNKMRIVAQSDSVTAHYILVRPGLDAKEQQAISTALANFYNSAEGDKYAKDFGSSRFVPINDTHRKELEHFRIFGEFIGRAGKQ